ncbi:potassium channel family protein [Cellulomonas rhizosphaerae]|uniref:Two pore domain potassium channel family protein n=1 Tax=Cellulomonas rhizosphaerae TaxID=2293719 RepID=A0A413RHB8_9CELL|nr:potassium channel family protein [Cellulomonas rhizosphaerae]RHA37537.1 two pore domain potassium channel family protein [Cellulomonas rhizosphaerae]
MTSVERWERRTEWPLTVAALVFLIAYAIPIAWPDVGAATRSVCSGITWLTWAVFALDYLVRLHLAERRWSFVRHNVLDLAIVVLPILRPLRLVRVLALVSVLNRSGARNLRGQVVLYAGAGTLLLVLLGALAITDAERGHDGSNVANLGYGFWWAATTLTTVGYGDRFPVTTTGRFVAVVLMAGGLALLGTITATLASLLVERVAEANEDEQAATRAQVRELAAEFRALRDQLPAGGTSSQ